MSDHEKRIRLWARAFMLGFEAAAAGASMRSPGGSFAEVRAYVLGYRRGVEEREHAQAAAWQMANARARRASSAEGSAS